MGDSMRTCGDCIVCCVYPSINTETLVKRGCEHCPNLHLSDQIKPNTMQLSSEEPVKCGIYRERPDVCEGYKCLWIQGHGNEEDRPDRALVLIDTTHRIENGIECKPLAPGVEETPEVKATIGRMMKSTGCAAIVTDFYERRFVRIVT